MPVKANKNQFLWSPCKNPKNFGHQNLPEDVTYLKLKTYLRMLDLVNIFKVFFDIPEKKAEQIPNKCIMKDVCYNMALCIFCKPFWENQL